MSRVKNYLGSCDKDVEGLAQLQLEGGKMQEKKVDDGRGLTT